MESVAPMTEANGDPVCLVGARSCPPEDVGGLHAHHQVAAWLRAGSPAYDVPEQFDDAAHAHSWLPEGYDPDAFDPAEATAAMRLWASGEHLPWHGLPGPLVDLLRGLHGEGGSAADRWLTCLGPRQPVLLDENDMRLAARPWLAVLDAVGAGTKLTAAGYLPPAIVEQIAQAAGVMDTWIGKANREDQTWPVAALREMAQEVGLLRKAKGMLTPTARAKATMGRPLMVVAAVLERLPLGKNMDADAGWFLLLGLASGETNTSVRYDAVARMLADRGWRMRDGGTLSASDAHRASRPTFDTLETMAGGYESLDPDLLTTLARATLFGIADTN